MIESRNPTTGELLRTFAALTPAEVDARLGASAIETVFREAGCPDAVFQSLLIEVDQVPEILADRRVAAVTLTGSERAGRDVAGHAGKALKKTVLELGGSDPFVVMPSADL